MRVTEDGAKTLMLIAKKGTHVPDGFADAVLSYQAAHVKRADGKELDRGDCARIAIGATRELGRISGGESGTISTSNRGERLPFFTGQGFLNHVMNHVSFPDGGRVALDLTARYTMDLAMGRYDVFAMRADSLDALKRDLRELYGTSWE